ncbi:MAG: hypothetical protein ABSG73_11050 [Candidatus Aminicenantales bacterium]|jgi:hypothetical protein
MNDRYVWGEYVVASIDVLGQGCQFDRINDLVIDDIPKETLDDVANKTIRPVEFVRDKLEELFLWSQKQVEPKMAIAEEDRAEYDQSRATTPIRFQFYSDSVLAYVALRSTGYQLNDLWAVRDMFISVGGTLLMTLAIIDASFRAAIELGIGINLADGDLYGPIRAGAYELEKKADFPRIIIGPRLFEYLKSFSEGRPRIPCRTERELRGSKDAAASCARMIAKDTVDGLLILDYLGSDFRERTNGDSQDEICREAWEYVKREFGKQSASGHNKVAEKFRKLRGYFKSSLTRPI